MYRILLPFLLFPVLVLSLNGCQPRSSTPFPQYSDNAKLNSEVGKLFLAKNSYKRGVYTLPSGLEYSVKKDGAGLKPKLNDLVTVYYQGQYISGQVFDNNHATKDPVTIRVSRTIPGWQEALTQMKEGAIWVIFVPSNLAYGERGIPGFVGPNQTLVYYIRLVKVQRQPTR